MPELDSKAADDRVLPLSRGIAAVIVLTWMLGAGFVGVTAVPAAVY